MIHTLRACRGAVSAPHHLAAQAGLRILREGGDAVEAMVAAAATIAVTYPHMNSLGGDGFWLIARAGEEPVAIDACGPAAALADRSFYARRGYREIPARGPLAALTTAGAIGGWSLALELTADSRHRPMPLAELLSEAAHHARHGYTVSRGQSRLTAQHLEALATQPGFDQAFLEDGRAPEVGELRRHPGLAVTLDHLGRVGLDDFYRGDLARSMAADLESLGSPLRLGDLQAYRAQAVTPLALSLDAGRLFNLPPPTQGLASLLILGILERVAPPRADGFDHVHRLVEATKLAFRVRDLVITDPGRLPRDPADFLSATALERLGRRIDTGTAAPGGANGDRGDTVWLGCIDRNGLAVSYIQSIFWEFGTGVVLPGSGILWQNRGTTFSLDPGSLNSLSPGLKPFHTLNPSLARLPDGRTLVLGSMGGEGQPQTQAQIFSRYAMFGQELQAAVTAPRWVWGRTWGEPSTALRMESRMPTRLVERLARAGHDVQIVAAFADMMGHAGAVVQRADGVLEAAADPRSDGAVAAF
jgi:gamma-glutamyltranspeptidase/glutathione hydrolase